MCKEEPGPLLDAFNYKYDNTLLKELVVYRKTESGDVIKETVSRKYQSDGGYVDHSHSEPLYVHKK